MVICIYFSDNFRMVAMGTLDGRCEIEEHNSVQFREAEFHTSILLDDFADVRASWQRYWTPAEHQWEECEVEDCEEDVDELLPCVRIRETPHMIMLRANVHT